jgi:hypothetical protein
MYRLSEKNARNFMPNPSLYKSTGYKTGIMAQNGYAGVMRPAHLMYG